MSRLRRHVLSGVIALCAALAGTSALASPALDQAIWLALTGRFAAAESLFVQRLADPDDHLAARNNLGNIHLLRGQFDEALAAYDSVLVRAPREAGTLLNRALLEHLQGDSLAAARDAASGIALAGGEGAAAWLMGIGHQPADPVDRSGPRVRISPDRVRELLELARRAVPPDSLERGPLRPTTSRPAARSKDRPLNLTTSGARGAVDEARVLYWKYGGER